MTRATIAIAAVDVARGRLPRYVMKRKRRTIERQREQTVAREPITKLRRSEIVAHDLRHDDVGARAERIHAQSRDRCEGSRQRCGKCMCRGEVGIVETGERGRGLQAPSDGYRRPDADGR